MAKPGDVIKDWKNPPDEIAHFGESGPTEGGSESVNIVGPKDWKNPPDTIHYFGESCGGSEPQGDNSHPSPEGSISLPDQGDLRVKDTRGDADPYPAKPGAR